MKRVRRPYQKVAIGLADRVRLSGLYWARRCRKSTTLGDIYFQEISQEAGRTAIGCSASLLLGKELIGMTLTALEQAEILAGEALAMTEAVRGGAESKGLQMEVANSDTGKLLKGMTQENLTDLYVARKMELRLYFDTINYSRVLILAPSVQTFRSFRALIGLDEFGYMPTSEARDLVVSADAMMRDTPDRKMLFACNMCLDDRHPWFEMTMPQNVTASTEDEEFPANPKGHMYIGQTGMMVHRVALKDAYAAGHLLYDDYSKPMSYEQCRTFPSMRGGWDISYALNHKAGGAAVIDLIALITAQRRGMEAGCSFVYVETEGDFRHALECLRKNLKDGRVAIGIDQASTTSETSNPTSITVTEKNGSESYQRLVIVFKEKKRVIICDRLSRIVDAIRARPSGGGPSRLGIDASNERLAAEETADDLRAKVATQLVIAGNIVDPRPAGYSEKDGNVNYKTYTGDLYATRFNEGHIAAPADPYFKADHRLTMKDGGRYVCTPDAQTGAHGDTFDSGKLAEFMLMSGGPVAYSKATSNTPHAGNLGLGKLKNVIPL